MPLGSDRLTPRQRQIMHLTCVEGLCYKQIGDRIGIHLRSVRNHLIPLFKTLGEHDMRPVCFRYGRGEFGDPTEPEA